MDCLRIIHYQFCVSFCYYVLDTQATRYALSLERMYRLLIEVEQPLGQNCCQVHKSASESSPPKVDNSKDGRSVIEQHHSIWKCFNFPVSGNMFKEIANWHWIVSLFKRRHCLHLGQKRGLTLDIFTISSSFGIWPCSYQGADGRRQWQHHTSSQILIWLFSNCMPCQHKFGIQCALTYQKYWAANFWTCLKFWPNGLLRHMCAGVSTTGLA